ncbi:hypothetical protein ACLGIH_20550 [Streptomyces sp. HMX87]|uniref:hypothetical protein n=1 Tax=Streptomyces sp. HMX87 TaxID=3390849 RepID=UPI003A88082C
MDFRDAEGMLAGGLARTPNSEALDALYQSLPSALWERLAADPRRQWLAAEFLARSRPVMEEARFIQRTITVRHAT